MPELDTFDLDAAFRDLASDVAEHSPPRAATLAVTTARRRRRRTTIGGAVVGLALALGAAAIVPAALRDDHTVAPSHELPAPAPFDGAHLTRATRGWTPSWGPETNASRAKFSQVFGGPCMILPRHGHGGVVELTNNHVDVAFADLASYGSDGVQEESDWRTLESQVADCHRAELVSSFDDESGALGRTYRIEPEGSDTAPEYLWLVSTGRGIGALKIFGQSSTLPSDRDRPVADALLAAVQNVKPPHTRTSGSAPGNRIDPARTLGTVWGQDLAPALVGWGTSWGPHDTGIGSDLPPCADEVAEAAPGQELTEGVGTDGGEWVRWFDKEGSAALAVVQLELQLASCSTPYTFHSVTLPGGRPVLVGVGPQVFWIERVASHVLALHLRATTAPPPDSLSLKVGAVLEHVLERPANTTLPPGALQTAPRWLQRGIAAAPTFGP